MLDRTPPRRDPRKLSRFSEPKGEPRFRADSAGAAWRLYAQGEGIGIWPEPRMGGWTAHRREIVSELDRP